MPHHTVKKETSNICSTSFRTSAKAPHKPVSRTSCSCGILIAHTRCWWLATTGYQKHVRIDIWTCCTASMLDTPMISMGKNMKQTCVCTKLHYLVARTLNCCVSCRFHWKLTVYVACVAKITWAMADTAGKRWNKHVLCQIFDVPNHDKAENWTKGMVQ